jgi:RHS repeat-associated protein
MVGITRYYLVLTTRYHSSVLTYSYYDANGELTGAAGTLNGSNYSVNYSYDLNGNRTMAGYQTGTGNELLSDGTYKYTYDKDGNLVSQTNIATGSVTYYTWDYRNRLVEVKEESSSGTVLNDEKFTYDVFNNRIAVSLNGTPELYTVYDGANPYMDFNGSGQLTERYLYNPNALSQFYGQVSANGTVQWFLTDNIHSIRQVVSASGTVLDLITYDPYGNILSQTNAANAPRFLYTGGVYDSELGIYYYRMRYYDPVAGRFESQDPLGLIPDSNPYRYVGNYPIDLSDPSGMWWGIDDLIFSIGGAVVSVAGLAISDAINGEFSGWGAYGGAVVGGAISGETLLYTCNPVLAGMAGGATGNIATQLINMGIGEQSEFNFGSLAFDTGFGGVMGKIPGVRIPGITSGRNSYSAIFKQMNTKFWNGTISRGTTKTAFKMFAGAFVSANELPPCIFIGDQASRYYSWYYSYCMELK